MFKIAVLASTNGTALGAVMDEMRAGTMPGIELARVVSNIEDCGALQKARDFGCEAIFVEKQEGWKRADYDAALIEAVGEVDLVCLIGYMRILTPRFIQAYENRIINVHPSLLPKYGGKGWYGMKVHEGVIANGEAESGMSIHMVTEEVDSGEIVLQKKVALEPGETPESLKDKIQALEKSAYPEAIRLLAAQGSDKLGG